MRLKKKKKNDSLEAMLKEIRVKRAKWEKKHSKEQKELLNVYDKLSKEQKALVLGLAIGLANLPIAIKEVTYSNDPTFRSMDCPVSGPGDPGFIPGPGGM